MPARMMPAPKFIPVPFDPQTAFTWHSLFWAEGSDFTALGLADTAAVTTWPNEAAESDATRQLTTVTYDAAHASFNNQPVVDVNSGYLAFTPGVDPTQPFSIVAVCRWASLTGSHFLITDADASRRIYAGTSNYFISNGTSDLPSSSATDTNAHLLNGLFSATANERLDIDGINVVNAAGGSSGFQGAIRIGADGNGNNRLVGQIALLGLYLGDITGADQWPDFKRWVTSHYGITVG